MPTSATTVITPPRAGAGWTSRRTASTVNQIASRIKRDPAQLTGQRVDAGEAERVGTSGRSLGYPRSRDRERQGTGIGEHVRGVGDEGERVREQAGRDLGCHEHEHHGERGREPAPIGGCRPGVVVPVRAHPIHCHTTPDHTPKG